MAKIFVTRMLSMRSCYARSERFGNADLATTADAVNRRNLNKLTFDLLTLKVISESRVMWATSVPILVFLGLSVLDLGPMYTTDRQTSEAHHRLMPPTLGAGAWGC